MAWRTTSERAKPGFIRLAVLDILKRKNLHAYGIIKAIRKETMGLWLLVLALSTPLYILSRSKVW